MCAMRKILLFTILLCLSLALSAQKASNVVAKQVGNTVEITYDLDKTAIVTLLLSDNGGETYSIVPQSVTGDVGIISGGNAKKIIWNMLGDAEDWEIERARFNVDTQGAGELTFTVGDIQFTMVQIEAGYFHSAKMDEFHIGKVEVTQAFWETVTGTNPSSFVNPDNPVENVSWNDCQVFIRTLNKAFAPQLGNKIFALPTEKQWQYAAEGASHATPLPKRFSGSDIPGAVAWFKDNSEAKTHKVAAKMANEIGLFDMTGNVAEWCGPEGEISAIRGGSWADDENGCLTANRMSLSPDTKQNTCGFRLVLVDK